MPVIALSPRLFPPAPRSLRVEAAGRSTDSQRETAAAPTVQVRESPTPELPPTEAAEVVDALLDALDDAELAALEELDTEDIEVLARQMHLRGHRRQHARGFLNVRA